MFELLKDLKRERRSIQDRILRTGYCPPTLAGSEFDPYHPRNRPALKTRVIPAPPITKSEPELLDLNRPLKMGGATLYFE